MDIYEILTELLKHSEEEIDFAILTLMIKKKLDSHKVFDLYMQSIEWDNDDLKDRLIESNTSILELLLNLKEPKSKKERIKQLTYNAIHRALYNLNISRQFNLSKMNEQYGYNEDEDKKLSWYWREHNKEQY